MMKLNNYKEWRDTLVLNKIYTDTQRKRQFKIEAAGNTRQDMSRPILEQLKNNGYTEVIWNSGNSTHQVCIELHDQVWAIEDFLSGLSHDAPLFEKSHPGDKNCGVVVRGPELQNIFVDSFGNFTEI